MIMDFATKGAPRCPSLGRDQTSAYSPRGPIRIRADNADSGSILIDEGVSGEGILNLQHAEIGRRRPPQGAVHISWPYTPPGSVLKFDRIRFLMGLDQHGFGSLTVAQTS